MSITNLQKQEHSIRIQGAKDGVTHYTSGIAVLRNNRILLVRRSANDYLGGIYELPGGGIDQGETFEEGVKREANEELGLTVTKVLRIFPGFDYQTPHKPKARQTNFLVLTAPGEVTLNPGEHDDAKWITENEVDQLHMSDEIRNNIHEIFNTLKDSC